MTRFSRLVWLCSGFAAISFLSGCSDDPTAVPPRELKLVANDGAAKDSFGVAVGISGNTAVVGAVFDDDQGEDSGSAYVFEKNADGTWSQQGKLLPPDGKAGDWFGAAVAISQDTIIVGAANASDNGAAIGVVHVFVRNGSTWTHQSKLVPSAGAADDQFGYAIGIDGDSVIVGAPGDDEVAMDAGAAYFFNRSGTTWTEQKKVVPTPGGAAGYFGVSAAISGNSALVGEWDDGTGKNAGTVFVYTTDGMTWAQEATLVASDSGMDDTFGYSVALSGDTALIGASGNDAMGTDSGAAYIFLRNGGKWTQTQQITASDGAAGDVFGYSVAIQHDQAAIGAYWDDDRGDYSGAVYLFGMTNGNWIERDKHAPADGIAGQKFGCSVAMDGDTTIAGAYGDNAKGTESGSVYVFSISNTTP